jgi:hypothetical protein
MGEALPMLLSLDAGALVVHQDRSDPLAAMKTKSPCPNTNFTSSMLLEENALPPLTLRELGNGWEPSLLATWSFPSCRPPEISFLQRRENRSFRSTR